MSLRHGSAGSDGFHFVYISTGFRGLCVFHHQSSRVRTLNSTNPTIIICICQYLTQVNISHQRDCSPLTPTATFIQTTSTAVSPTPDVLVPEDRTSMSQYTYTPAPRTRGGDYRLDDDTALVMQRSGPINHDLAIIQDYATNPWSADEMVSYYNVSKSGLISKGLITAMQLHTICRGVGAKHDEVEPNDMASSSRSGKTRMSNNSVWTARPPRTI